MARPLAPRGRVLPDLASVLVVYVLIAVGCAVFAGEALSGEPDFPSLYERLPIALLALLPAALLVIFAIKARALAADLRARRYGSRLRLRLSLLFLLAVAAASIPQGAFLMRLANAAQASSSSRTVRKALAAGQDLALAWYDEELSRLERAAARVAAAGEPRASELLRDLAAQDPRMEAVQVFRGGAGADFAGSPSARLASVPAAPAAGAYGNLLPVSASGGASLLRYAAPLRGNGSFAVLSLRLPAGLEGAASLLGNAARTASLLEGYSTRWATLVAVLYGFLALPLLLVAIILGMTASDLVAEPLASLDEATRRVAAGDFGVRLIVKPGDETGRLVASFNRMLTEIERSRVDDVRRGKIDAWKDIAQRLAHELKNPLTPIRLAAERVLRKWRADPAEAASIVEGSMLAIIKEVEGMDALLGDFRSFASLPEPQRDWVGLRELVADSVALYEASYPEVSFGLEGLPEGMTLRVDRASMKRALCNLVTNSIDAMDGAGRIEIGADLVKAADSRYCRLRIRDTGRGISADIGDRIFVPYFTTKESGTGLGLSIVERIVSEHGGSIRFESEEGAGTTFFVDLPLDR
jgi:two-component system, NtrC family, nitrogen regulation sensor histidine kinase NtrY